MESYHVRKKRFGQIVLSLGVFLIFMAVFLTGIQSVSSVTEETEMENIEKAVVQSAVLCYGTKGAYPESLAYLKEHYGLNYNEEKYIVDYEIIAKNIRPQVRVVRLSGEGS